MRVFKFSETSNDREHYVRAMVERGEIYFSPPAKLNDPFEYASKVSFADATFEEKFNFWRTNPEIEALFQIMSQEAQSEYIQSIEELQ